MIRLSAVIITLNEERNIGRCLASLKGIADEIVVVDSGSLDRTKEICISAGAKFIVHGFEGYIQQKNFALTQCSFDHILAVDADEALSPELQKSIVALKSDWQKDGYVFNRLTNYCGQWIRHCGWYPDRKLRLFRKGSGTWGGSNPHDRFEINSQASIARIHGDLLHYSYYTIDDHLKQVNNFTGIEAKSAYDAGKRSSLLKMLVKPIIKFLRGYFFRLGILDGYYGYLICRISANATFIKYAKLRQLHQNKTS